VVPGGLFWYLGCIRPARALHPEEMPVKKSLKKLVLNRESLLQLSPAEALGLNGGRAVAVAGTHYESICHDLCKEEVVEA
jgi:hypothetical protein